jgi:lipopolysaccharide export system protein LptA
MTVRFRSLSAVACVVVVGCGSPKPSRPAEVKTPDNTPKVIHTGQGESTQFSADAKRERLWDIEWESAGIGATGDEKGKASMQTVTGHLYRDAQTVSTYQGDAATADQTAKILILRGNVQVKSLAYDAVLHCDEIRYEGQRSLVRARGHVRIVGKGSEVQSATELWATPDLRTVGSPEAFLKL